jgi:hypothetical protein
MAVRSRPIFSLAGHERFCSSGRLPGVVTVLAKKNFDAGKAVGLFAAPELVVPVEPEPPRIVLP